MASKRKRQAQQFRQAPEVSVQAYQEWGMKNLLTIPVPPNFPMTPTGPRGLATPARGPSTFSSANGGSGRERAATHLGSEPPAKRARSNYATTIQILVGEGDEAQPFTIHKDLIYKRSSRVRERYDKHQQDYGDAPLSLPRENPIAFGMYVERIYNESKSFEDLLGVAMISEGGVRRPRTIDEGKSAIHDMCLLWDLSNYLSDTTFTDQIMDHLIYMVAVQNFEIGHKTFVFVGEDWLNFAESPLRKWLVDAVVAKMSPTMLRGLETSLAKECPSFTMQLLERCAELIPKLGATYKSPPQPKGSGRYHVKEEIEVAKLED